MKFFLNGEYVAEDPKKYFDRTEKIYVQNAKRNGVWRILCYNIFYKLLIHNREDFKDNEYKVSVSVYRR